MEMKRIEKWEMRLSEIIESARKQPYALGTHDCLSVALTVVEALTGRELWSRFQGRYSTAREANRLIGSSKNWPLFYDGEISREQVRDALHNHNDSHFDAAFSLLFGGDPMPALYARRGDICKYVDRQPHLGVCVGSTVAVLKPDGLAFVSIAACEHCWRIG
jgi:hypothetical protein